MAAARMSLGPRVLLGAAVGLVVLGAGFAPAAAARMRCSYSGAPQNLLSVTADREALGEITRRGRRIVVREFLGRTSRCRGAVPTVRNTDTIRVRIRPLSFADVQLGAGPFAPGATPEAEGAAEIEIEAKGDGDLYVIGTPRADEFHWGPGRGTARAGLNLNPREAGDQDVDVTVRGELGSIVAAGRAGNDTIIPEGVFRNNGVFALGGGGRDLLTAPRNSGGVLEGGKGDDVLIGGRLSDYLSGDRGDDRLRGRRGRDAIHARGGRDLIFGGPQRDHIYSRDAWRDRVSCGAGRDRVSANPRDRLRHCEVIRR